MSKLYFRHAAMNAGKSTYLLQVAHNYESHGKLVVLVTAALDNRTAQGVISSRLGISRPARVFEADTSFEVLLSDVAPDCVLVDEAQFLTATQVRELHRYAHATGVPVICFGLRSDFRGEPFEGAAWLLALADDLEEIKTICACSRKASMNVRIDAQGRRVREGAQVLIGAEEAYRSVCPRCFYEVGPSVAVRKTNSLTTID